MERFLTLPWLSLSPPAPAALGRPCRYAEAILSCVQQLGLLASGQQPEPGGVDGDDGLGIFLFFLGSTAAVMGWAWLSNRKRSKRYKVSVDVCLRGKGVTACAVLAGCCWSSSASLAW